MLDTFVRTEGDPEVVQFSGGEPTLHPQLLDFIKMAQDKGIRHVMVNTNGRRLVEDPAWADEFCALNPMVYLQFDGFEEETYLKMRGESLLDEKMAALEVLDKHNINTILTATIERDVNEHEIPAIIKFGFKHPAVRGVMLQPVFHTGRHLEYLDPMNRVTIPELILRIDAGMDGQIVKSDFIPVPCCHPSCQSIAYAYIEGEVVTPLARIVNVDEYLDYITNRVWPDPEGEIREALAGMWSSSAAPGSDTMADDFVCATCNIDFRIPSNVAKHIFAITIKDFQDPYTFDIKKLMKCCVEIATPDGRLIPFCAYNTVGYREDVKKEIMMSRARERFERRTNGSAAKASAASSGDSD
ncbi:MAG: radical SAM protein [Chloroflexi bacterium]|nr:radical SAM protein [Chloroflexota bacterium]